MCGIIGIMNRGSSLPPSPDDIVKMIAMVRHRGPESAGIYIDDHVGLGQARLSIIDLEGGLQPLTNEDQSLWLVCNGEIFNYIELREELEARGHRFRTGSDCETILHLYEEHGFECVHALNGQFAFALWDLKRRQLLLGRDRFGIRPLFYTDAGGYLLFGSEVKALLTHHAVSAELDRVALGQIFTSWSPVPPRTMFKQIYSLPAGHTLVANRDGTKIAQYWRLNFSDEDAEPPMGEDEAVEQLRELLLDATRLQLRADVPVGSYVSGGLDSSAVTAIARRYTSNKLQTFGIAFTDGEFDERPYQERVAQALGTEHHTLVCRQEDIARVFPALIWHTETPLVRTAPAPLFMLSQLVREHGFKVVLTGEGADEFLIGYDIFKETKVRSFWARRPESKLRPLLLQKLYHHIPDLSKPSQAYLQAFFGAGLDQVDSYGFSHMLRWTNTSRLHRYFTPEVQTDLHEAGTKDIDALLARQERNWHPVSRAQYNEVVSFLEPYLLSSQGDRVAMAHAVEGRVPFLDHHVVEFCNSLPPGMKMHGLREKGLLRRAIADLLPAEILERPKQPFRAPIHAAFVGSKAPEYVRELLDPHVIAAGGLFKPQAVTWLLNRAREHDRLSELENMALVGIISTQLFIQTFWSGFSQQNLAASDVRIVADQRTNRASTTITVLV